MEEIADNINMPETETSDPLGITFETTEENLNYTLSKQDFEKYFEGDEFNQKNLGNCWLISPIMSLVKFGDYEKLIRTSVKMNDNGFIISLPLGSPEPHTYSISFEELNQVQRRISGDSPSLVEGKLGIQALVLAYGKMSTGKDQFDYINLAGGNSSNVFYDLVYGIEVYSVERNGLPYCDDPYGACDQDFLKQLRDVLENFNKNTDMISLYVSVDPLIHLFSHYSMSNHEISVKNVKKDNGKLIITVGNMDEKYEDCDITFEDLITACGGFSLGTKNKRPGLKKSNESYVGKRKYIGEIYAKKHNKIESVNQLVLLHGKEKEALREARGDIVVTDIAENELKVSSYGLDTKLAEKDGKIIISIGNNKISISKSVLSNKYEYEEKIIANNKYPFYLYGVKIANFINMMRNLYINPQKWDKNNDKPFCLINGAIQFDDDPEAFEGREKTKRKGKEKLGDDYIKCLNDWKSLGIKPSDDTTQQRIVKFLNKLVKDSISE